MRKMCAWRVVGLAAMWLAAVAGAAVAQTTSGSVAGVVRDAQGAGVPGAMVVLVSDRRGTSLEAVTSPHGDFVFPTVPPDTYTLKVSASGFKTFARPTVEVNANDRLSAGVVTLEVGSLTEVVTVNAETSVLQTQGAERSYAVDETVLQNIAVNGRTFMTLAFIAPGVVMTDPMSLTPDSATMSANGQRPNSNNLTIDGITNMDTGNNSGPMASLSLDAVAEFKLLTSNYQAEHGRSAGAQISVVTKSGGRDFRGSGYFFRRHDRLNANSWINNRDGAPKPRLDQRDLGYTIGGPIFIPGAFNTERTKLFFFFGQEHQRRINPESIRRVRVPTALERDGDFSQSLDSGGNLFPFIRDHTTGLPCGAADTRGCFQADGVLGRVPRERLYQLGLNVLRAYPLPNAGGRDFNYETEGSTSLPERQDLLRVDWQPSSAWRFTGRLINNTGDRTLPYGSFVLGTNMPDFPASFLLPRYSYSGTAAATLNNTTFLEVNVGTSHNSIDIIPTNDTFTRASLGLTGFPTPYPDAVQLDLPPQFDFGGRIANGPFIGTNNGPFDNFNTTYDVAASLTKVWNRHTIKTGFYFHRSLKDQSSFAPANGTVNFDDNTNNPFDTGFAFANAATGIYNSYTQSSGYFIGEYRYANVEWYVQDNWKPTDRLTLDYGVRFAWIQPQYDAAGLTSNFDASAFDPARAPRLYFPSFDASGTLVALDRLTGQTLPSINIGRIVPGSGDPLNGIVLGTGDNTQLYRNRGVHVGPRFGFTYDPTGDLRYILRGGGGIFYDRPQGNTVFDTIRNPPTTLTPTFNYGRLEDIDPRNALIAPPSLFVVDQEGNAPTVYAFNLGVQVKLPFASVLDMSYVGSVSHHFAQRRNLNGVPYGATYRPESQNPTLTPSPVPGATALPADFLRPYQGYGDITLWEFAASQNYHSLQTSFNRRFRDGVLLGVSYTWSKALGTTNNDFSFARIDDRERQANYGPLDHDRRHSFVTNFVWELPRSSARGILGGVLNDWQLSGIYRWESGSPYTVEFSIPDIGNQHLTGSYTEGARVGLTGNPGGGSSGDPYRQFDTGVFTTPATGSLGLESGRLFLYRAPANNLDLSISKSFPLGGGTRRIELRADAFNALNHTQFFNVNATLRVRSLTDPTPTNLPFDASGALVDRNGFGTVSTVRSPRVMQLVARIMF